MSSSPVEKIDTLNGANTSTSDTPMPAKSAIFLDVSIVPLESTFSDSDISSPLKTTFSL